MLRKSIWTKLMGVKTKSRRFLEHQFLIVNISLKCRFLFHPCLSFIFKCENKNKCLFLGTTSLLEELQGMIIFTLAWVPFCDSQILRVPSLAVFPGMKSFFNINVHSHSLSSLLISSKFSHFNSKPINFGTLWILSFLQK